jgi:hypothetical protein
MDADGRVLCFCPVNIEGHRITIKTRYRHRQAYPDWETRYRGPQSDLRQSSNNLFAGRYSRAETDIDMGVFWEGNDPTTPVHEEEFEERQETHHDVDQIMNDFDHFEDWTENASEGSSLEEEEREPESDEEEDDQRKEKDSDSDGNSDDEERLNSDQEEDDLEDFLLDGYIQQPLKVEWLKALSGIHPLLHDSNV